MSEPRFLITVSLVMLTGSAGLAQSPEAKSNVASSPTITAAISADHVRFTALGEIERMRLEVFSSTERCVVRYWIRAWKHQRVESQG
jgi:hypothetical protein